MVAQDLGSVNLPRRRLVGALAALAVGTLCPSLALAQDARPGADPFYREPRTLWLARGDQQAAFTYWRAGNLQVEDYAKLCWLLRDVRAGQHVQMDLHVLEVLRWIQHYARSQGFNQPIQVLSGYRTPATNRHTEGAAKNSMHLYGKAVDFRLQGVSTASLGAVVQFMQQGGAGVYTRKDFVHADTGALRSWRG